MNQKFKVSLRLSHLNLICSTWRALPPSGTASKLFKYFFAYSDFCNSLTKIRICLIVVNPIHFYVIIFSAHKTHSRPYFLTTPSKRSEVEFGKPSAAEYFLEMQVFFSFNLIQTFILDLTCPVI